MREEQMSKNAIKHVIFIILLQCLLAPAFIHAKELEIGMPFLDGRKLLIREGWRPLASESIFPYPEAEEAFHRLKIFEVESCAMDAPVCAFNYKKDDTCLQLFTYGAEIKGVTEIKKGMHIYNWSYSCPDENGKKQKNTSGSKNYASMGISLLDRELPFLAIRKMLKEKGWQPTSISKKDSGQYAGMGKQLIAADIREVEGCAINKTDEQQRQGCVFDYKKGGLCLQISADGGNINDLKVIKAAFECPDKN
jgi:hypothetical protein